MCLQTLGIDSLKCSRKNSAPLLLLTAGYKLPVNKNKIISSGHGLYFEIAANPAKIFCDNVFIGFYGGLGLLDRAWNTSFSSAFVSDYHESLNTEAAFNQLDSSVISAFGNFIREKKGTDLTVPGCEMKSFRDYAMYYGVIIKLPCKHGPVLKLYTGTRRSHLQAGRVITEADYNNFQLRRILYGCELLVCTPVKKTRACPALSFYAETAGLKNAMLYFSDGNRHTQIAMSRFTSAAFTNKYNRALSFGVRFSFLIPRN
jgi:hypothetical protein